MSPAETYKIELEQIKSAEADKATKDLASKIVKLSRLLEKLSRIAETVAKVGGDRPEFETIKRVSNALSGIEKTVKNLEGTIGKLESGKIVSGH